MNYVPVPSASDEFYLELVWRGFVAFRITILVILMNCCDLSWTVVTRRDLSQTTYNPNDDGWCIEKDIFV